MLYTEENYLYTTNDILLYKLLEKAYELKQEIIKEETFKLSDGHSETFISLGGKKRIDSLKKFLDDFPNSISLPMDIDIDELEKSIRMSRIERLIRNLESEADDIEIIEAEEISDDSRKVSISDVLLRELANDIRINAKKEIGPIVVNTGCITRDYHHHNFLRNQAFDFSKIFKIVKEFSQNHHINMPEELIHKISENVSTLTLKPVTRIYCDNSSIYDNHIVNPYLYGNHTTLPTIEEIMSMIYYSVYLYNESNIEYKVKYKVTNNSEIYKRLYEYFKNGNVKNLISYCNNYVDSTDSSIYGIDTIKEMVELIDSAICKCKKEDSKVIIKK